MKKTNSMVIATIIATFVLTMFAFQPTTEAGNNVSPSATPSPRRKLPRPVQSPITVQSPKPGSARTRRTSKPRVKSLVNNENLTDVEKRRKQQRKRSTQRKRIDKGNVSKETDR